PSQTRPKPQPKPAPNLCRVLKVTPGMVKANGSQTLVIAKVTKSKTPVSGVAVRSTGIGLNKVVKTDKQGVARIGVAPSKAGIMLVRITNVKACNSARIGVVGVFEPPVTGCRIPRARTRSVLPGASREHRRLGEGLAGPQGPVGLSASLLDRDLDPGGGENPSPEGQQYPVRGIRRARQGADDRFALRAAKSGAAEGSRRMGEQLENARSVRVRR